MADITDVFAWMDSTGNKVNLVMDVSPGDPGGSGAGSAQRHFGPSILYVFHVNSVPQFGAPGTETKVICKFDSDTSAQCWVGTKGYVKGDPTAAAGVTSTDGKVKLFAGRRSDPFFFNFNGFADTADAVDALEGSAGTGLDANKNAAGCLVATGGSGAFTEAQLEGAAGNLRNALGEATTTTPHAPCAGTSADCFANFDVQAIVLQIDKSLLNASGNSVIGVWASTNMAM